MMNDKSFVIEQLDFVETNLPLLAAKAKGNFMDPKARPKDKRVLWTEKSYTEAVTAGLAYHRDEAQASWPWKRKVLFGLKEFVLSALNDEFERFRDVYMLLQHRWIDPSIDIQNRARLKQITFEQAAMELFDRARKCPGCGKPVYIRDLQNNYIDLKKRQERGVCGAKDDDSCPYARNNRRLRDLMVPEITKVRSERDETKKVEEARKEKKKRLHGTEYPVEEKK